MQKPTWQAGAADTRAKVVEVLYIDKQNQICTTTLTDQELTGFKYQTLAWRDWTPVKSEPKPVQLGTVYWNYVTGKFWPLHARKPPNPKLPNYFKILIWLDPDGSHRLEYKLVDKSVS